MSDIYEETLILDIQFLKSMLDVQNGKKRQNMTLSDLVNINFGCKAQDTLSSTNTTKKEYNDTNGEINDNKQKATPSVGNGMQDLYASMMKQNQFMSSMQKLIIRKLEEGITNLESDVTRLEEEISFFKSEDEESSSVPDEEEDELGEWDERSPSPWSSQYQEETVPAVSSVRYRNLLYHDTHERLNSIEITGIPLIKNDENLSNTVLEILQQIGVTINHVDFEECYRLKESTRESQQPIVCRFFNRNICQAVHACKRNLRNVKLFHINSEDLYINDYLCGYYKKLAAQCRRMKKNNVILDTWSFKGFVKIKLLNGTVKTIKHQMDLDKLFPNYKFF